MGDTISIVGLAVTIVGSVVAFAVAWGRTRAQFEALKERLASIETSVSERVSASELAGLKERLGSLEQSRDKQGERLGAVESDLRLIRERDAIVREVKEELSRPYHVASNPQHPGRGGPSGPSRPR